MIWIGERQVGIGLKPYVIAEAATQHFGRVNTAKSICRRAKRAGADAVKFQLFVNDEPLFCPLEGDEKRWPRWQRSMMSFSKWKAVKETCDDLGIDFLASAFQKGGVEFLKNLGVKAYKVASRAATTFPYGAVRGPFIVSCGQVDPVQFNNAMQTNPDFACASGIFLECKMEYPHRPYRWVSGLPTYHGLSDHSGSPWPSIEAMARGCALVEVHVSFFKDQDAAASVTPVQLRLICDARDNFAALRSD